MKNICELKDVYKTLYQFEKEFYAQHDITINQGMLLCCMKDYLPKSAQQICEFIGLSNSRVSRIINSVEEKGYILRSMGKDDKRKMMFTLSKEGKDKIEEMMNIEIELPIHIITKTNIG